MNDAIPKNMYRDKYMKVELLTGDDIVAGIRRVKLRFPGYKLLGYKEIFTWTLSGVLACGQLCMQPSEHLQR